MIRDFTEESKNTLLGLVDEVEEEKWCDFTDWCGDRLLGLEAYVGNLDVKKYVDDMDKYHKKVIDKNNTTSSDIISIFNSVYRVSDNYKGRYIALSANIQQLCDMFKKFADTINPRTDTFVATCANNSLEKKVDAYLKRSAALIEISGDGLSEETLNNLSKDEQDDLLYSIADIVLNNLPDMKTNGKIEIPLGPNLKFYYQVEIVVDGTGDNIEIEHTIEDQKVQLANIKLSKELMDGLTASIGTNGEGSIKAEVDGHSVEIKGKLNGDGAFVYEYTIGDNTYTFECDISGSAGNYEIDISAQIATNVQSGSVASKVGIVYDSGVNWQPLPELVPIESPYTCQLPQISAEQWETIRDVAIVTAEVAVVVGVVVVAVGSGQYYLVAVLA